MRSSIFILIISIMLICINFDEDAIGLYGDPKGWVEPPTKLPKDTLHPYKLYPKDTTPYKGNYVIPEIQ